MDHCFWHFKNCKHLSNLKKTKYEYVHYFHFKNENNYTTAAKRPAEYHMPNATPVAIRLILLLEIQTFLHG